MEFTVDTDTESAAVGENRSFGVDASVGPSFVVDDPNAVALAAGGGSRNSMIIPPSSTT